MIAELLKAFFIMIAVFGWIFIIASIIIYTRWNQFVQRNPNAQDIMGQIILRVIFLDR